jgi:hypothetical protein
MGGAKLKGGAHSRSGLERLETDKQSNQKNDPVWLQKRAHDNHLNVAIVRSIQRTRFKSEGANDVHTRHRLQPHHLPVNNNTSSTAMEGASKLTDSNIKNTIRPKKLCSNILSCTIFRVEFKSTLSFSYNNLDREKQ